MRCVEAWSMVIPWVGFPLRDLLLSAEPNSKAKYVAFETVYAPEQMPVKRAVLPEAGFSIRILRGCAWMKHFTL